MYLDENIELNFEMPATLKTLIDEIDMTYKEGRDFDFLLKLEEVESTAKQCKINNRISEHDLHSIFCRYGLR